MNQANIEVLALAAVNMRHEYNDANAADEIMNAVRELCYLRERNAVLEGNQVPLYKQDAAVTLATLQARSDAAVRKFNEPHPG